MYTLETRLEDIKIKNRTTGEEYGLDKYFFMIGGEGLGFRVEPHGKGMYVNCLEDNFKWVMLVVEMYYYDMYKHWSDPVKLEKALRISQVVLKDGHIGTVTTVREFIQVINAIISNL